MELALITNALELIYLNNGRSLVIGERYKVRRSDGGKEDGWQLTMFRPDGKLVLTKEVSTRTNCQRLRN
jgi:hypothetical protein